MPNRMQYALVMVLDPVNNTFDRKSLILPFHPNTLKLGRQACSKTAPAPDNGYFDSRVLSRAHAEVWTDKISATAWITDAGSANGTYLNGARISEPSKLTKGDLLELGIDITNDERTAIVHHKVAARVEQLSLVSLQASCGNVIEEHTHLFGEKEKTAGTNVSLAVNLILSEIRAAKVENAKLQSAAQVLTEISARRSSTIANKVEALETCRQTAEVLKKERDRVRREVEARQCKIEQLVRELRETTVLTKKLKKEVGALKKVPRDSGMSTRLHMLKQELVDVKHEMEILRQKTVAAEQAADVDSEDNVENSVMEEGADTGTEKEDAKKYPREDGADTDTEKRGVEKYPKEMNTENYPTETDDKTEPIPGALVYRHNPLHGPALGVAVLSLVVMMCATTMAS